MAQSSDIRCRYHLGLELPDRVLQAIVKWQRAELDGESVVPIGTERLWLTLHFLGRLTPAQAESVGEALPGLRLPRQPLRFEPEPAALPGRGRPGLFFITARCPGQEVIRGALKTALAADGVACAPRRGGSSVPLPVGWVRADAKGRRIAVKRRPGPLPRSLGRPFEAVRVGLYRSQIKPQGSECVPLARVELPRRGGYEVIN